MQQTQFTSLQDLVHSEDSLGADHVRFESTSLRKSAVIPRSTLLDEEVAASPNKVLAGLPRRPSSSGSSCIDRPSNNSASEQISQRIPKIPQGSQSLTQGLLFREQNIVRDAPERPGPKNVSDRMLRLEVKARLTLESTPP